MLYTFVGRIAPGNLRALSTRITSRCRKELKCVFVNLASATNHREEYKTFAVNDDGLPIENVAREVLVDGPAVREYLVPFIKTIGKDPIECVGADAVARANGVNHVERWPLTRNTK